MLAQEGTIARFGYYPALFEDLASEGGALLEPLGVVLSLGEPELPSFSLLTLSHTLRPAFSLLHLERKVSEALRLRQFLKS